MRRRIWSIVLAAFALLTAFLAITTSEARADAYFDQGVRLYNQRNFKAAWSYFDYAMRSAPDNSNAFYYAAMNYQQMGDIGRAKQIYKQVIERFPTSEAAKQAVSVLQRLDPSLLRSMTGQNTGQPQAATAPSAAHSDDRVPDQETVYFKKEGNSQIVEIEVDGRSIDAVFDTGAAHCVFGKNHLSELGVRLPNGPPIGYASGVGSNQGVPIWQTTVRLRVGRIIRNNFPITVQEELSTHPLLGETFFNGMEHTTDPLRNTITFRRKGLTKPPTYRDPNAVPFVKQGNELIVIVEVNGKKCPMFFDTGADKVCFSPAQLEFLGISIPDDARKQTNTGIGGSTTGLAFQVDSIKLGPIQKYNVDVSVVDASQMHYPLLGQSFFGDWRFTVDNENKLIRFQSP